MRVFRTNLPALRGERRAADVDSIEIFDEQTLLSGPDFTGFAEQRRRTRIDLRFPDNAVPYPVANGSDELCV